VSRRLRKRHLDYQYPNRHHVSDLQYHCRHVFASRIEWDRNIHLLTRFAATGGAFVGANHVDGESKRRIRDNRDQHGKGDGENSGRQ